MRAIAGMARSYRETSVPIGSRASALLQKPPLFWLWL